MPASKSQLDGWWKRFDPILVRIDRLISGKAPADPLYITNRSWQQKAKNAALAGAPVLLLIIVVAMGSTDLFRFRKVNPYEHTLREAAARPSSERLPELVLRPADLEVVNIRIAKDSGSPSVTGIFRNNTNQKVDSAEVTYYLADTDGSLLATETANVANVQPHGSVAFHAPLKTANAEFVIVGDVHLN